MQKLTKDTLKQLLQLENPENDLCLSVYARADTHTLDDLQTRVKATALEASREDERTNERSDIHKSIAAELVKRITEGDMGKGVAAFTKFNIQNFPEGNVDNNYRIFS